MSQFCKAPVIGSFVEYFLPQSTKLSQFNSQLEVLIHFYILQNTALRSLKNENRETPNPKNVTVKSPKINSSLDFLIIFG